MLLQRPGIEFLRGLRSSLERDPGYLNAHQDAITFGVKELLNHDDIFWEEPFLKKDAIDLIREALSRMQIVEEEKNSE